MVPVLLVLAVATTEIGRALYEYNTVAKAVRNAARYMSMQDPVDVNARATARNLVVYGRPDADADGDVAPLAVNLSLANIPDGNITWQTTGTNPTMSVVTVRATNYVFRPLIERMFGLELGGANGGITFPDIRASMRGQL